MRKKVQEENKKAEEGSDSDEDNEKEAQEAKEKAEKEKKDAEKLSEIKGQMELDKEINRKAFEKEQKLK